jgi:hypothetical protein
MIEIRKSIMDAGGFGIEPREAAAQVVRFHHEQKQESLNGWGVRLSRIMSCLRLVKAENSEA